MQTSVLAETELAISAPSAMLIEAGTGKTLFEKNPDEKLPPASVTKIMTMLLTIEAVDRGQISLDDMVRCSENAASMGGSQVFLEPGEEMSVHDMLKAVAVASGNDAAVALAEFVAGSAEGFSELMNKRAAELGMENTHFVNCNGLDAEGHLTTARDISLMSRALVSHPKILEFTSIWMDSLRGGAFGLVNTNKLIRFYEGANGLKTGSTSVAKFCVSASAVKDGMNLIAVIMAAPTSKDRFRDATKLLDYGFANYAIAKSLVTDEELGAVRVTKGRVPYTSAGVDPGFNMLISKSRAADIQKNITLPEEISAPVSEGEVIGTIDFSVDGELIGTADIVAKEAVAKINPIEMLTRLTKNLLYGHDE